MKQKKNRNLFQEYTPYFVSKFKHKSVRYEMLPSYTIYLGGLEVLIYKGEYLMAEIRNRDLLKIGLGTYFNETKE